MTDARTLTLALGGHWRGRYGTAACPMCQPERRVDQDALTLSDGRAGLLADCKKLGCAFRDILKAAGIPPGDWQPPDPAIFARRTAEDHADRAKRERQAAALWREAQPINGTIAETYLRGRAIACDMSNTLRFHPACWHGATATRHPALVALVEGGEGFAVHRTYLRADDAGKADLDPAKAMLGTVNGGAVRLADGPDGLAVAEGIETALSLICGLLRGPATIWAALSTSGLRGLILPPEPGRITIAADGDDAGRAAAQALAERADALGWRVSILPAPEGRDWNDILRLRRSAA